MAFWNDLSGTTRRYGPDLARHGGRVGVADPRDELNALGNVAEGRAQLAAERSVSSRCAGGRPEVGHRPL